MIMGNLLSLKRVRNILILVALDGSDTSNNALRQTIRFARAKACGVTVVTVLPPYDGDLELGMMPNIKQAMKEPGEKILDAASKIAVEEGVEIETTLETGNIHESIIDVAIEKDCDMIVIGRSGKHGIERALMGSTTARVIGYSPIDVLVMPNNATLKWDNILLAVDGSRYSEIAANRAINMAQTYGEELSIMSVVDVNEEFYANAPDAVEQMVHNARDIVDSVQDLSKKSKIKTKTFVREGQSHEKIIEMARELQSNIICLGSHGRTGLRRLLMGSVTEKVIGNAPCPVLVVKSH
jgi:nucleotide-binding universal stress UspA family protein